MKSVILFLMLTTSVFGQKIDSLFINSELNKMTVSSDYKAEILKISANIDGFVSVLIKPAYRDFPNIVVFHFDTLKKEWLRPYETFCAGIQDATSDITDLHTKGFGIDFNIGKDTVITFNEKTKKVIEAMSLKSKGTTIIPYQYFFHSHYSTRKISNYTIDKTNFANFALKLNFDAFSGYPKNQCIMYDMPKIETMDFIKTGNYFQIIAITSNKQKWVINFTGLQSTNDYFESKSIEVSKL